jgi:tRNA nucleotidyltransferase (CCA-adding enzyme)
MPFNPSMRVQNPNPGKTNQISIKTLILYTVDNSYRFRPQAIEILNGLRQQGQVSDSEIEKVKKSEKETPKDKINQETGAPKQDDTIITLKDGTALTKEMLNTPEKIEIVKANKNNLNFAFLIPYLNDEYLDEFIDSDSPQIRKLVAENIDVNKLGEFSNELDKDVLDVVIERITAFDGRKLLRTNPNLNAEQNQKLTNKIENFDMFINDLENADINRIKSNHSVPAPPPGYGNFYHSILHNENDLDSILNNGIKVDKARHADESYIFSSYDKRYNDNVPYVVFQLKLDDPRIDKINSQSPEEKGNQILFNGDIKPDEIVYNSGGMVEIPSHKSYVKPQEDLNSDAIEELEKIKKYRKEGDADRANRDLKNLKEVLYSVVSDDIKELIDGKDNFTIKSIKEEFDYINTLEGQDFFDVMSIIKEKNPTDKLDIVEYIEPEKLSDYFIFEIEHDPEFYKKKTDIEKEETTNKITVYRGGRFKDNRGYVTTDEGYAKEFGKVEKLLIDKNDILDLTNPEHRELISSKFGADMLGVLSPNADELPNVSDRITLDKIEDIAKKLGFKATAQNEGEGLENSFDVYDGTILEEYKNDIIADSYFKDTKDNIYRGEKKVDKSKDNYTPSGYYNGTYYFSGDNAEEKAKEFGENISSINIKDSKLYKIDSDKDADKLKKEATKNGFYTNEGSGYNESKYLEFIGYDGIQRGDEIIIFDNKKFKNKGDYADAFEKMAKDNYEGLISIAKKFSTEHSNKTANIKKEIINNLEPDDLMLFAEDDDEEIREILSYKVPKKEISGLLEKYTTDEKLEDTKSIINLIDRDTREEDFSKLIYYNNANVRKAISSKIKDPQILEKFLNSELSKDRKSKTTITNILSNISENQIKNIEKYNPELWNSIRDFMKDKHNISLNDYSEFQTALSEIEHNKKEELKQQELSKQEEKESAKAIKTVKKSAEKTYAEYDNTKNPQYSKDYDDAVSKQLEDLGKLEKTSDKEDSEDIPLNYITPEKGKDVIKHKLDIPLDDSAKDIFKELNENGNKALIVGGSVRDALLGKSPKDIDIEVYNINYKDLNEILSKFGKTDTVGKAFGIIKFTDKNGNSYDFSLPRKESKTGIGHKGFDVEFDDDMTPKEAASRRDFTWNGIAYDPVTDEIHDYYNGISDLKNNILKHISEKFKEDPLRILRAMQFQGRYGFDIDKGTMNVMKKMVNDGELDSLALERITEEWSKWASKSKHPSKLFDFLRDTGLIEKLPYLSKLKETEQDPEWHPEGNVEEHTKHVMNAAVKIADRDNLSADDRTVLMFAALLHDIAKPQTTAKEMKNGKERITSKGHEQAGGKLADEFLKSIGVKQSIIDKVIPLVENHLSHVSIASIKNEKGQLSAIRKLAVKLGDATITDLLRLIEADTSGRPPLETGLSESGKLLQTLAKKLKVTEKPEPSLVTGKDLLKLGFSQGKELGDILKKAKEAQYEGEFDSNEKGIEWIKDYMEKKIK